MKKNKLSFLIVSSLLAISSLVGCNTTSEDASNGGDSNSIVNSDNSQGGQSQGGGSQGGQSQGGQSQGGQSQGGGSQGGSSQGGGSQGGGSQQGGSSQGGQSSQGGSSSQGGGSSGGQQVQTDWTDDQKNLMKSYLHGEVLPFVNMEFNFHDDADDKAISIQSKDFMAEGFLRSYLQAFYELDSGWECRDISTDYNAPFGTMYEAKKTVQENGKTRYVVAKFGGAIFNEATGEMSFTPTGRFYLEALDPYLYGYPAEFIGQWLLMMYGSSIVPPDMHADYYGMEEEGVLLGYTNTNLEDSYKQALLNSKQFTIDANKDNADYYVAHPSDGAYTLRFKYDSGEKTMILRLEGSTGWNKKTVSDFFTNNNQPVVNFPALNIEGATYRFVESSSEGYTSATYMIQGANVTKAALQGYVEDCRTAGFVVNMAADETAYTLSTMLGEDNLYLANMRFASAGGSNNFIMISMPASGTKGSGRLYQFPTQTFGTFLSDVGDNLPSLDVRNAGYTVQENGDVLLLTIYSDTPAAEKAVSDYKTLLLRNNYTVSGDFYVSEHEQLKVGIGHEAQGFEDYIFLRVEKIEAPEPTEWPSEDITDAIDGIYSEDPITDTIPALNVGEASECYVNDNYVNAFEIVINGLTESMSAFKEAFKGAGWKEDKFYAYDSTTRRYGVLISPNTQLVAYFEVSGNYLSIYIAKYWNQNYAEWPADSIAASLTLWGVEHDAVPAFNSASQATLIGPGNSRIMRVYLGVDYSLQQLTIDTYKDALKKAGYNYYEGRGYLTENSELTINVAYEGYQGQYGVYVTIVGPTAFKVLGLNDVWNYNEGTIGFVDATDREEVSQGKYVTQLKAEFDVNPGDEFKVYDGLDWYGYAELETNTYFIQGPDSDNIQAKQGGHVELFLKTMRDGSRSIYINFTPSIIPWPSDYYNGILESWGLNETLPSIEDEVVTNISSECDATDKILTICLAGGEGLYDKYIEELRQAGYKYDEDNDLWLSPSSRIGVFAERDEGDLRIYVYYQNTITYTLICDHGGIHNANAVVYAYVWGGVYSDGQSGEWIELEFDENNTAILANIDASATGFKIVRMNPDGNIPSFDQGTVWNETGDINFPQANSTIHFRLWND